MWTKELGHRLQEARLRRGWEVSQLAKRADLVPATIYNLEKAERSDGRPFNPRQSTYKAAVKAVGDQSLADDVGVDLDGEVDATTRLDRDELRLIIDRRIGPALASLYAAIDEAVREAVEAGRDT